MSKIEKLSVRGIRSFAPLSPQTIEFFTPLTLIVGYNGSGKTTIIECLKYATTSELPPNSKGGAFIHDPKLCGEREVLAQVKLKYKTPPDTTHVVTHNLSLTVKKTQRAMKTLEGSLNTTREGETTTMSRGKAKLYEVVPRHLGVGIAILDSVIFCHQDESLWPMSEPSALKKRFDEIFEALKYTKAVENLKLLRKKQGEQLTKMKVEEGNEKTTKEKADRCEKRSIALQDEIEALRSKCQEVTEQMDEAEIRAKQKYEEAKSYQRIDNDLRNKQQQLEFHETTLEGTKARMDEMDESDSWLQDTLAQYEERVSRLQKDHQENVAQYGEYQKDLGNLRDDLSNRLAENGKLKSDKEKYERQLESRVELIHHEAQSHGIRGFDGDLDDEQVQSFHDRMQKLLADKKRDLERFQRENAEELDKHSGVITELEGRKQRHTQDRVFAIQQNGRLEKRIASVRKDLNSVDIHEGAKALLDSSFKDIEQRLQKSIQDLQNADLDTKIQDENDRLQQLENESSRLGDELAESIRLTNNQGELNAGKKQIAEKKRELDTLISAEGDKLSNMIGNSWEPATVERQFKQALQVKTQAHEDACRKRDEISLGLKEVQKTLSQAKGRAKKRDEEMGQCKSIVLHALKACNPEAEPNVGGLSHEIRQLEEEGRDIEKDIALSGALTQYYRDCERTLNTHNKCELCLRPFANDSEKSPLLKKIRKVLDRDIKELQDDLAVVEQQLGRLRAVNPESETYERLMKEKPAQEKEIREAKEQESNILRVLEGMDEDVRQKQEERQDLESMDRTVGNIAYTRRQIEDATAQVDRITSQQKSSATVRSAEEIKGLQDDCGEQIRALRGKISKLSSERQRMGEHIKSLELQRSESRNKLSDAIRQLERKRDLENQIQTLKDEMSTQRDVIHQADKDLESIEPQITNARSIRKDVQDRGRSKEKKLADERDNISSSINGLSMVENDIQDYIDRGGQSLLDANEKAIQYLKKRISGVERDMNDLTARTNKLKEEINNSSGNKKNIIDNLNYRKTAREIEQLRADIEELESHNAKEDYDRSVQEAKAIEANRDRLNAERGSMMGAMKTKDEELAHLLIEWETEYHDAARKYREAHIRVETTKAAIEDLGRYSQALNNAIMKYHSLKMEEVNQIAGELWRETYQGTDIDTIMIKSDSEGTTGRSTYNYRVCMVKQDTEMDMRGRCSAGQKVLASIIIRLALAESFGVNCGLIALDEPTTNLDRDNIKSLAESLHNIIKARRAQRNFQLIVITHDEDFLRHMRCSDFCDNFYRVTRDPKQNSVIKQESIATIM